MNAEEYAKSSEKIFLKRMEELLRSRKYGAMRHLIDLRKKEIKEVK